MLHAVHSFAQALPPDINIEGLVFLVAMAGSAIPCKPLRVFLWVVALLPQ